MEFKSPALDKLVEELQKLPGIGSKTAERLAHHILRLSREDALQMAAAIEAGRAGARVVLLEKNPALGGTTIRSVGSITTKEPVPLLIDWFRARLKMDWISPAAAARP